MTMSSVDEYPRVVKEPISRHADLRPSSNPFKKAFRFSSSPIPVAVYTAGQGIEVSRPSADVPEVLALVRGLGRGLDVLELRGDLVDLLRLVLQLVEGDLDAQVLREHVEHGLRGLRVDEIAGRLAHQAHRLHVVQPPEKTTPYFSISFTRSAPVAAPRTRGFVTMRPMPYPPSVNTRRTPSFFNSCKMKSLSSYCP